MPPLNRPLTEIEEIEAQIPTPGNDPDLEILSAFQADPRETVFANFPVSAPPVSGVKPFKFDDFHLPPFSD